MEVGRGRRGYNRFVAPHAARSEPSHRPGGHLSPGWNADPHHRERGSGLRGDLARRRGFESGVRGSTAGGRGSSTPRGGCSARSPTRAWPSSSRATCAITASGWTRDTSSLARATRSGPRSCGAQWSLASRRYLARARRLLAHALLLARAAPGAQAATRARRAPRNSASSPGARAMGVDACLVRLPLFDGRDPDARSRDPFCGHGTVLAVANALGLTQSASTSGSARWQSRAPRSSAGSEAPRPAPPEGAGSSAGSVAPGDALREHLVPGRARRAARVTSIASDASSQPPSPPEIACRLVLAAGQDDDARRARGPARGSRRSARPHACAETTRSPARELDLGDRALRIATRPRGAATRARAPRRASRRSAGCADRRRARSARCRRGGA